MERIDWKEIPRSEVRAGMRVGPLASWSLDVAEVIPEGWVCTNLDTGRPMFYRITNWDALVPTLHHDGRPSVAYDGRHS